MSQQSDELGLSKEYSEIARDTDAYKLQQMVDLGLIPCVGAIAEKIQSSPELNLDSVIQNSHISPIEQLKLVAAIWVESKSFYPLVLIILYDNYRVCYLSDINLSPLNKRHLICHDDNNLSSTTNN